MCAKWISTQARANRGRPIKKSFVSGFFFSHLRTTYFVTIEISWHHNYCLKAEWWTLKHAIKLQKNRMHNAVLLECLSCYFFASCLNFRFSTVFLFSEVVFFFCKQTQAQRDWAGDPDCARFFRAAQISKQRKQTLKKGAFTSAADTIWNRKLAFFLHPFVRRC